MVLHNSRNTKRRNNYINTKSIIIKEAMIGIFGIICFFWGGIAMKNDWGNVNNIILPFLGMILSLVVGFRYMAKLR